MNADGLARFKAVVEVIAFHHARHGVARSQSDHSACAQGITPFAVVANFGFGWVKDQGGLFVISFSVDFDLLCCEWWTRGVSP